MVCASARVPLIGRDRQRTPALLLNRGLSGDTVARLLARLDDTVPPQAHIQRAFMMIRINDLLRRHYHLPTFIAHYEALVERLLAAITLYLRPEQRIQPVALVGSGSQRQGKEHD
jgi:lysophospholipase L1-like esterase